jgi:hypothetical protein
VSATGVGGQRAGAAVRGVPVESAGTVQRATLITACLGTIFSLVRGARVSLQPSGAPVPAPLPITEASMD